MTAPVKSAIGGRTVPDEKNLPLDRFREADFSVQNTMIYGASFLPMW